jgi:putative ABC transport system permease protein
MAAMSATVSNDLEKFKAYVEEHYGEIEGCVSDIQYTYDFDLQVFSADGKTQVSPSTIFDNMGSSFSGISEMMESVGGFSVMSEMINNQELLDQQYELVGEGSHWPTQPNEVVLVVGKNNQISMMTLYMLGVEDQSNLEKIMTDLMKDGKYESAHMKQYKLEDFLGMKFYMLNTQDFYYENGNEYIAADGTKLPEWSDKRQDPDYNQTSFVTENGMELVISGIIRPREGVSATSITGAIGYTKGLTDMILDLNTESKVINQQKAYPDYNVLTGLKFERTKYTRENIDELIAKIDTETKAVIFKYIEQEMKNQGIAALPKATNDSTFLVVLFMLPEADRIELITDMVELAKANQPTEFATHCATLSYALMNGITVTPDNVIRLLPIMNQSQIAYLVGGDLPMDPSNPQNTIHITGLMDFAGDAMESTLFGKANTKLDNMSVDEEFFLSTLVPNMPDELFNQLEEALYNSAPQIDATYESNLLLLGDAEKAKPASINFYAKDFESKEKIEAFIKNYNDTRENDVDKIEYSDLVGTLMSSVSLIINVISYVLIAFVSISLVVSSIMIGIITYISVLERTKEIGILRSIGASKKDISRVFNAETLIVGLTAGLIGIIFTLLICLPVNAILHAVTGMNNINAILPWVGGVALVLISMFLTFIAGLIPSRLAAKKDPVEALRTE